MRVQSRIARPAAVATNLLKSVGYTVVLWAVFFAAIPAGIQWAEELLGLRWTCFPVDVCRLPAVIAFSSGGLIGIWSGVTLVTCGDGTPMPLECTRHLVIAGPYRCIRNPMAAAGIAQGVAVGIYLGPVLTIFYALVGGLIWHWVLRPWEEQDLATRFGADYQRYRQAVPLWLPRLTPFHARASSGGSTRVEPGRVPGQPWSE